MFDIFASPKISSFLIKFMSGNLAFETSNNDSEVSIAYVDVSGFDLTPGDANAGSLTIPYTVFAGSLPPGTFDVRVILTDATGNTRRYGPSDESLPSGSTTTFVNTATPPANNHFGDASVFGPALPATTNGTTIYATLETGESDLDGEAGASVWYAWTAPSSGWVRLAANTPDFNRPIFAVFSGTVLSESGELGRSDNVNTFGNASGPLVFHATSGTTYHIAVYGFSYGEFASTGTFSLSLESIAQPAARISGFSLAPPSVDVANGPQQVTLQVNLETDTPFGLGDYINAYLTPNAVPDSSEAVSVFIPHNARLFGTDTSGTYPATLDLPGWYEDGLWNLVVDVTHAGVTTRWSPTGSNIIGDKFLIPQASGQVILTNSGSVDLSPPVLVSLSGLPSFADVSTPAPNPVPVTLEIAITDDASGFSSGHVYLVTSTENSSTSIGIDSFGPGDGTNGVYQVDFDLTESLPAADYTLEVHLYDLFGRVARYGGYLGPNFPIGSTTEITISHGPAGGYLGWAATQDFGPGGLDGLLEDANQDGTKNLLCYAFNIPPFSTFASPMAPGGTSGLPIITVVGEGANRRLRIEYLQRRGPSGLIYRPQFCSNPGAAGPEGWQTAAPLPPAVIDADWERVIVEDAVTGSTARFGRVAVEYTNP